MLTGADVCTGYPQIIEQQWQSTVSTGLGHGSKGATDLVEPVKIVHFLS